MAIAATHRLPPLRVLIPLAAALLVGSCGGKKQGKPTPGYFDTLADAKAKADLVACQARLRSLGLALTVYADDHDGKFPDSLAELVASGAESSSLLACPGAAKAKYVYIPGQNQSMPFNNILVYEAKCVHGDRANVFRLGGVVEALTQAELTAAVAATKVGGG